MNFIIKNKHLILSIMLAMFVLSVFTERIIRPVRLIDLQKEMVLAKTDSGKRKILRKLDKYYLSTSIPDSIRQRVRARADTHVKQQERKPPWHMIQAALDTNIYQVECDLKKVLREVMIAKVRGDDSLQTALMEYAKLMADSVDSGTGNDYWRNWAAKVAAFRQRKAMNWLIADQAAQLCHENINNISNESELFGITGLKYNRHTCDCRLQLDITQRLFIRLYRFKNLFDLSFAFIQREIEKAKKINYHLRTIGMKYYNAEAHYDVGENTEALNTRLSILSDIEKYNEIPCIDWYKKNCLLGMAKINWQLGNYQQTLATCNEIDTIGLDDQDLNQLHIVKGVAYRTLGNFDKATIEYNKTIKLASRIEDFENHITALKNLGTIYYRLTEYDKSILYYKKAMDLHLKYNPTNFKQRCKLLICIAEIKAEQRKITEFNEKISVAYSYVELVNFPLVKGELLRSIGHLKAKLNEQQQACDFLRQAISIYENNGLLRAALETKIILINSLISISKFDIAEKMLDEVYPLAKDINDPQFIIDILALCAQVNYHKGNIDQAIINSNRLTNKIEHLNCRFIDNDNLMIYRQRNHEYLQQAVFYELQKGRTDSALIKLDYMKFRNMNNWNNIKTDDQSMFRSSPYTLDLKQLQHHLIKNQMIVNYFLYDNTIYAFIIKDDTLRLLKKTSDIEKIKQISYSFLNSINRTIIAYKNIENIKFKQTLYDSICVKSKNLYLELFGWKEMQQQIDSTDILYIIPDEFLYYVPFSCLLEPEINEPHYLIQKTAIIELPNCVSLQQQQEAELENELLQSKILFSFDYRFPGAYKLRTIINKFFPQAEELIISKPDITKEDVLEKLNGHYDIYMLLGHSSANLTIPDSSYFELTALEGRKRSPKTVKLYWNDIKNIDWSKAKTVFLIGCETANGKHYKGTGLVGIHQNIIAAGVSEVIASLWKIDENKTIEQIISYLNHRTQKERSAFAFQKMQTETIKNMQFDNYYKHPNPYFWGSLVLMQNHIY